jgi:hypothetical protein
MSLSPPCRHRRETLGAGSFRLAEGGPRAGADGLPRGLAGVSGVGEGDHGAQGSGVIGDGQGDSAAQVGAERHSPPPSPLRPGPPGRDRASRSPRTAAIRWPACARSCPAGAPHRQQAIRRRGESRLGALVHLRRGVRVGRRRIVIGGMAIHAGLARPKFVIPFVIA